MKIVLVSGGFDPLHSGHIEYFKAAKSIGDYLIVAVNSDEWLVRKKGKEFQSLEERKTIISNLKMVDEVISFDDKDGSACNAIQNVLDLYPNSEIVFANGGDRVYGNTPELMNFKDNDKVRFEWGVGGSNKVNSSSWLLEEWRSPKTIREWGYWRVLDNKGNTKVKELVIYPKKRLSDQYHNHRNELWYVVSGECSIKIENDNEKKEIVLAQGCTYEIPKLTWHQAINRNDENCHVIEIQYGDLCEESDIVRRIV